MRRVGAIPDTAVMTLRSFFLFVHVAASMGVFGTLAIEGVLLWHLRRATDPTHMRDTRNGFRLLRVLAPLSLAPMVMSGMYLVRTVWGWRAAWINVAFASLVLAAVVGVTSSALRIARLRKADDDPIGGARGQIGRDPIVAVSFVMRTAIFIGIVFLMTVKPGWEESLIGMGMATAGGLVASLAVRRAGTSRSQWLADGRLKVNDTIARRTVAGVSTESISIPDSDRLVHLQFRRFAGCPVCNLHLQSFRRRHTEIAAAGIREVVVFHSTADDLRPYTADLPFVVIADPDKRLYREFGVESSLRALFDPRAWPAILRGIMNSAVSIVRDKQAVPSLAPHGGRFGLPADFLIAPDGRVLATKYGIHADDQWSAEEVVALAQYAGRRASST
jgi:peroxiredoxin